MGTSVEEIAAKQRTDEIYTAHPYYGSRRMAVTLRKEGYGARSNTKIRFLNM